MTNIFFSMFEGWISLFVLMVVPVIYLLIFRDIPKKLLFVFSTALVTAGTVQFIYYLAQPLVFWAVNIVPETCKNEPDALSCKFFQLSGGVLDEIPLIFPIVTAIIVAHIMAKRLWVKLVTNE